MATYWIVVPRGNQELFDLLSLAFHGHSGFSVIVDRRSPESQPQDNERRAGRGALAPDEIIIAEQTQQSERQGREASGSRMPVRVPARRRTARRSSAPAAHRFATL